MSDEKRSGLLIFLCFFEFFVEIKKLFDSSFVGISENFSLKIFVISKNFERRMNESQETQIRKI